MPCLYKNGTEYTSAPRFVPTTRNPIERSPLFRLVNLEIVVGAGLIGAITQLPLQAHHFLLPLAKETRPGGLAALPEHRLPGGSLDVLKRVNPLPEVLVTSQIRISP
jgi:hypothetical protein